MYEVIEASNVRGQMMLDYIMVTIWRIIIQVARRTIWLRDIDFLFYFII